MSDKQYPNITEHKLAPCEEKIFNTFSGFMLVYVKEGAGTLCLNDKNTDFTTGTAVVMSCLDYIKIKSSDTSVSLTVLEFSEDAFSGRILDFFSLRNLPILTVFEANREKTETILELMASSIGNSLKNNDIFIRNLSKEILIYTIKNNGTDETNAVFDIKTELAILHIYSHFKEALTIEKVSAHVHYSASYFYHNFQKHTGTTFQKFLHNLRLTYAMNLIRFTDLSISDICYECGYNSTQYFSTAFRKKFGKSPKNFINDNLQHKGATL